MKHRFSILKLSLMFALFFLMNLTCYSQTAQVGYEVGDMAPEFSLEDMKGENVTSESFKGKKPVMLVFFQAVG